MRILVSSVLLLSLQGLCIVPASADQKADALLAEMQATYKSAETMTATMTSTHITSKVSQGFPKVNYKKTQIYKMQKPGKISVVTKTIKAIPAKSLDYTMISDGKTTWEFKPATNEYVKDQEDASIDITPGLSLKVGFVEIVSQGDISILFFKPNLFFPTAAEQKAQFTKVTSQYIGTKKVGDVVCQVVVMTLTGPANIRRELYIGPDKLIHREITHTKFPSLESDNDVTITDIKLDPPLTDADFTFVPPAGAKEVKELK